MNFFVHFYKILSIRFQEKFKNVKISIKKFSIDKISQKFVILFSVPTLRNLPSFKKFYRRRKDKFRFYFEIFFRSDVIEF